MSMVNASADINRLERLLQAKMLGLPLGNPSRLDRQALVLGWDGMRVIWVKSLTAPPAPTAAQLEEAIAGLQEDIAAAFGRLFVQPVPIELAAPAPSTTP